MNYPSKPRIHPTIVLTIGILSVSTAAIFIRFAQEEAPSLVIAAYRLVLATLLLAPFAVFGSRKEISRLQKKEWLLLLVSGFFLSIHFYTWITSLSLTSVASSVVLVTTTPLWVALLSPLILKEKINKSLWPGLILAMAGGIVVAFRESCSLSAGGLTCNGIGEMLQGSALLGNFLALVGAWMASGYMMIGRYVRPKLSLISYSFLVYGFAALFLMAYLLVSRLPLAPYSSRFFLFIFLLAAIPQLLGHSSLNWALKYVPATFVSLSLLGEPVGSTILAVLLLRENPSLAEIVGGIMILCGIYLASRLDQHEKQKKELSSELEV
jgi:drug/metabolite transporter (DMT)-like permease